MSKSNVITVLTGDDRFIKHGSKLRILASNLYEVLNDRNIQEELISNIRSQKNFAYFLNMLQYANQKSDYLIDLKFDEEIVSNILQLGLDDALEYDSPGNLVLKEALKSDYIDFKDIDFTFEQPNLSERQKFLNRLIENSTTTLHEAQESKEEKKKETVKLPDHKFEAPKLDDYNTKPIKVLQDAIKASETTSFKVKEYESPTQVYKSKVRVDIDVEDTQYWIDSVRLDFPVIPQPNIKVVLDSIETEHHRYCRYGESTLPWNQSQITSLTDINRFNKVDIMKLFPLIRLYTRSPYMYQKYEGLDYDDDLGVIFKISDYTEEQIKQNILEYPHLDHLDRIVKIKGKSTAIPFWKHIELDGEIVSTASIWDELEDTKILPKTESFMNEYVVRKYILDTTIKNVVPKYPMRGSLKPFLTLYDSPEYYEAHGYDSLEVGRKCVEARQSFKQTRNPVLRLNEEYAKLSVQ